MHSSVFVAWTLCLAVLVLREQSVHILPHTAIQSWTPIDTLPETSELWRNSTCRDVSGLVLPELAVESVRSLEGMQRLCPVVETFGVWRHKGSLVVRNTMYVNGVSVNHLLRSARNALTDLCGPCDHGLRRLPDCQCICETGWTGASCDQRDLPANTPVYLENPCVSGIIDTTACPGRANWGHDFYSQRVGTCGGGYESGQRRVSIGWMTCDPLLSDEQCLLLWRDESPVCCSPGTQCGPTLCDFECCVQLSEKRACMASGCRWLGTLCTAANATLSGEVEETRLPRSGIWRYEHLVCETDNPTNVCDRATAQQYLDVYDETNCTSKGCYSSVRQNINAMPWARLGAPSRLGPGFTYHMAPTDDQICRHYLDLVHKTKETALAVWECGAGAPLHFMPSGSGYYIYTGGYCLSYAPPPLGWQTRVNLLGAQGATLPTGTLLWTLIGPLCSVLDPAQIGRGLEGDLTLVVYKSHNPGTRIAAYTVDIPFIPDLCLFCTDLGGCAADDTVCLKEHHHGVAWETCCPCLWRHTAFRRPCLDGADD